MRKFRFIYIAVALVLFFSIMANGSVYVNAAGITGEGSVAKFNMSYLYFGDSSCYVGLVEATKGALNEISPSYFDLNPDGSLKINKVDTAFIKEMHSRGIKVVPFLSNHWDREKGKAAIANADNLAAEIAGAIERYGLDGVNVDIENLTGDERAAYVDFVRILRSKLPAGKSLSVAVAPNPYNYENGWQASYDYAGLALYSDYLMVMAYDQHYQGSEEGPVADGNFVEKSIQYALKKVQPDKVVLGMPFYGRLWKKGSEYGGYGISNYKVEELVKKYSGIVQYDYEKNSPKATIVIKAGDVKPVIAGKKLEAGTYTIWFENERSIKYKISLANKHNLKGTGSWSLGQEPVSTWDYYGLWLNGKYFSDILGNWAEDYIAFAAQKGWMTGATSSMFLPQQSLTRAEAATVLARALGLKSSGNAPFSDISGHWAKEYIEAAYAEGLVQGAEDGRFYPDQKVTRAQMAVILSRILENTAAGERAAAISTKDDGGDSVVFKDVTQESIPWAYEHISFMAARGILTGYPDGLFYPKDNVTRAQMAALMSRLNVFE